jgi:hypothetical protein
MKIWLSAATREPESMPANLAVYHARIAVVIQLVWHFGHVP